MAEYTSRHTGLQIDEALDSALNVKQVRGIVKMTDAGPVAAVPGEDFPADSGSTVSVTGLLKGVLNAETGKIEIQQATAGTDYQTPLTAGADYATPSAVANKQNTITAAGLLKGLGDGSVAEATPGEDYQPPIPAGTYATPATDTVVTASASAWSDNTITLSVTGVMADSKLEIGLSDTATDEQYAAATAAQIRATGSGNGTVTLKATTAPTIDLPIIIRRFS